MSNDGQSANHAAGCLGCGALVVVLVVGCLGAGLASFFYVSSPVDSTPPPDGGDNAIVVAPNAPPPVVDAEIAPPVRVPPSPALPATPRPVSTPPPSLLGYDLGDDRDVRELTASMGSLAAVYQAATPDEREDLLALLQSTGRLRRDLAALLPLENDTALRATMLGAIDPQGYFQGAANDPELEALLDAPTSTPIGEAEWVARIDLAARLSPHALTRTIANLNAANAATPATQLAIDVARVRSTDTGAGARSLRDDARRRLRVDFEEGRYDSVDGDLAARGYEALATAPDAAADLDWWVARLAAEQRPPARAALVRIIDRLSRPR